MDRRPIELRERIEFRTEHTPFTPSCDGHREALHDRNFAA